MVSKPYIAKVTCQPNMEIELVDDPSTIQDKLRTEFEPVNEQPNSKYEPKIIFERNATTKITASYPPPPPLPLPPPPASNRTILPPRTARSDFITPDQRAIFGPPVVPFERTDRVGGNTSSSTY